MPKAKEVSLTESELRGMLAEAVHTAFRKGSDHPSANTVWHAIRDMPMEEWGKVMTWCHWSLFYAKKQPKAKAKKTPSKR